MQTYEKNISKILSLCTDEITEFTKRENITAVVNAARPTLMGGTQGVDGSIHRYIDNNSTTGKSFNDIIREKTDVDTQEPENKIRCERGKAVVTSGESLSKYVLHVVGSEYDGKKRRYFCNCSSSCIDILESCYREIVNEIKHHPDIETVVIPIIGAGEYGFPWRLAVKIALASVGNALVDWKNKDQELFDLAKLRKIYFCIYSPDGSHHIKYARKMLEKYNVCFSEDKKVVYQNSFISHIRYWVEMWKYDYKRGYFAIARLFRLILLLGRFAFMPIIMLKDVIGGYDWQRRRSVAEFITIAKVIFSVGLFWVLGQGILENPNTGFLSILTGYFMIDTVTYLILLIVMADIQRPSANVIRSIMLLLVNYIQVSFDISNLYILINDEVNIKEALYFGIMGDVTECVTGTFENICLAYLDTGLKFFFMTLAFGYFANGLKQRRYSS